MPARARQRDRGKPLPIYVTRAEAHSMFAAAKNGRDRFLLEFLWHTAARITEALAARVGDLTETGIRLQNLKQGEWTDGAEEGSRVYRSVEQEKHVFLHPTFLERLRAEAAGMPLDAYLFRRHSDGGQFTRQRAEQIVHQCADDAGVYKRRWPDAPQRPASPHLFRHGAAVNWLLNGVPITVVQRQLGHASLASTQLYTAIADADAQRAIAAVEH